MMKVHHFLHATVGMQSAELHTDDMHLRNCAAVGERKGIGLD